MKIYAKQVAPEYQESPLFMADEMFPDDIALFGNDNYKAHFPPVFELVQGVLDAGELAAALEDVKNGGYYSEVYRTATAAIVDHLPPDKARYSTRDIHHLKELVKAFASCRRSEEDEILCKVLSIVTGQVWESRTIRGCCQSDWQTMFYPVVNWNKTAIERFESEYFNTGSEWIIHDEDGKPESPDDISGYSLYCTAWNEDGLKQEIAENTGCAAADVVLYIWDGWQQSPIYKAV